jgi:hypothetical protein
MKFKLEPFNRNVDEKLLIGDLQRVNKILQKSGKKISFRNYNELGKYSSAIISNRFGSWNNGLSKAGINLTQEMNVNERKLFENLKEVWLEKGGQPVFRDMAKKPSKYSGHIYNERFGGWRKALEEFVDYYDSENEEVVEEQEKEEKIEERKNPRKQKRTSRHISERMRFAILLRDGFRCQSCGRSPLKNPEVDLHVDHILPWTKGGETTPENLQTKCKRCNLGKGNAFDK